MLGTMASCSHAMLLLASVLAWATLYSGAEAKDIDSSTLCTQGKLDSTCEVNNVVVSLNCTGAVPPTCIIKGSGELLLKNATVQCLAPLCEIHTRMYSVSLLNSSSMQVSGR